MYFNTVHGKNIALSSDNSQARRTNGFCQSITFSANPLTPYQRITFQVGHESEPFETSTNPPQVQVGSNQSPSKKTKKATWNGGLRIGLTSKNPITLTTTDLPIFSYPSLLNKEGFWITDLKSSYLKTGNKISLILDKDNALQLFINYVLKASLFENVKFENVDSTTKLWLVLDLYGTTNCIQFLPSDLTPYEIKARGLDAVNNFHSACLTGGSKSIFKTKLIIVGQEGVGKSSLRNALVNLNHKRKKALGLNKTDASASFRVSIDSKSNNWQLKNIKMGDPSPKNSADYAQSRSAFFRASSVNELSGTADVASSLEFKLSSNKRRSSSTSYLNEDDDYDNDTDTNKPDQFNKQKSKHKSLDKLEVVGSNQNSKTAVTLNTEEAINETLNGTSELDSDSDNDSSGMNSMDNLFAIDECDEKIMPNQFDSEKYEFYYREIALNIYQELFTTKLYEKLWPSALDTRNNTVNITETSNAAINNFTESFFEKLALVEFDMSIYSQLECSLLLRELYEKIVKNELQEIQNKSNTIVVNPAVRVREGTETNIYKNVQNKKLSLTILDFAGQSLFYTTHQIFLSSRAVYLICFDLTKDLDDLAHSNFEFGTRKNSELTNLEFLDLWMRSIHSHTAKMPDITTSTNSTSKPVPDLLTSIQIDADTTISFKNSVLSPPIIIVGTNKNSIPGESVEREEHVRVKLAKIREFVSNKVYFNHIVEPYLAVDASIDDDKSKKEKKDKLNASQNSSVADTNFEKSARLRDVHVLKKVIELAGLNEPYMGEQQPLKWMSFEKSLEKLKSKNIFYASLSQICEIAHEKDIKTQEELTTCLNFLHDLGNIIYYGNANDIFLRNTIILRPQKLVDIFKTILNASTVNHSLYLERQQSNMSQIDSKKRTNPIYHSQSINRGNKSTNPLFSHSTTSLDTGQWTELWNNYNLYGILDDRLLDVLLVNVLDQKPGLLGLMKKFDLICEKRVVGVKTSNREKFFNEYLVPSRATANYDEESNKENNNNNKFVSKQNSQDEALNPEAIVEFYYDFCGFLPESLFHRILTRASSWTLLKKGIELKRAVRLYWRKARYQLDERHDFILEMAPLKNARIKIQIIRLNLDNSHQQQEENSETETGSGSLSPEPNACAKVRNFMESTLIDLRNLWMKRLMFNACVQCCCQKVCVLHQIEMCPDDACIHFLNLDECLTNNIVSCDYRRVKTMIYKNWFPTQNLSLHKGPVLAAVKSFSDKNMFYEETNLPNWIKNVAKVISLANNHKDNVHSSNHIVTVANENDWQALARLLGYTKSKINTFMESKNPALQLLCDWIMSSDNTNLTIEFLLNYLEQIKRQDACVIINNEREKDTVNSSVFISYHWDSQEAVIAIKENLEKAGFKCFMDVGQIGGGNLLYQKIDQAIRNAQVIIACITPKFVVSHFCNREMALADLIRKPIVPIMLTATPWPPPGGMSLIFSQLVYVDYYGVGGHGGCGINADRTQRNNEIIAMVSRHINPSSYFLMNIDQINENETNKLAKSSSKKPFFDQHSLRMYRRGTGTYSMNDIGTPNYVNTETGGGVPSRDQQQPQNRTTISRCSLCNLL